MEKIKKTGISLLKNFKKTMSTKRNLPHPEMDICVLMHRGGEAEPYGYGVEHTGQNDGIWCD